MKVVAILVLAVVAVTRAEQVGYSIQSISQSGVLFEHLGRVNFYTKHWTIFSTVGMPDLTEELGFAVNCSSLVARLCSEAKQNGIGTRCAVAVKEIESWVSKIKRQNEELSHHTHGKHSPRQKRSFFDGVGSLAKTLFGTMDQTDAENIYATLDDLNRRENRTFDLLKDQITIVKSTFDLFNASRVKAAVEREELWNKVAVLVASQQNQDGELAALQRRVELNEILTLITLQLREISDMQETFVSILVALSMGKLHPLIIHAEEMTSIMKNATKQLDLDETFQNFQLLIQIAKVKVIQSDQNILIRVDIPQPQRIPFDIYKVYTIPAAVDESGYHIYDLGAEFVVANNHERQYAILNDQQYQKCQQLTSLADHPHFLCQQLSPIITAIGDSCVLNLFRSFNVKAKACKERVLPKWNSLVRMVTRNHWLFVMASKTKLEVNCRNSPTAIGELSSTGILIIEEYCHLQIGDLLINSEDDARRNATLWQPTLSELPLRVNIEAQTVPNKSAILENTKREVRLLAANNFNKAWREHEADIQKMQDAISREEKNRQQGHPHHVYLAATSISGILSIVSLTIVAAVVIHLKRWKQKQVRKGTSRLSVLPAIQRSIKHPQTTHVSDEQTIGDKEEIEVIVPTTANLPTGNLPTVVGKQLVQIE